MNSQTRNNFLDKPSLSILMKNLQPRNRAKVRTGIFRKLPITSYFDAALAMTATEAQEPPTPEVIIEPQVLIAASEDEPKEAPDTDSEETSVDTGVSEVPESDITSLTNDESSSAEEPADITLEASETAISENNLQESELAEQTDLLEEAIIEDSVEPIDVNSNNQNIQVDTSSGDEDAQDDAEIEQPPEISDLPLSYIPPAGGNNTLVIINTNVDNYTQLVDGSTGHVLLIDNTTSLNDINDKLHTIDAEFDHIEIWAHSNGDGVTIGETVLDSTQAVAEFDNELETLASFVSPEGSINLFGCGSAQTSTDVAILESISNSTDLVIRGSVNATGKNTDYVLEYSTDGNSDGYRSTGIDSDSLAAANIVLAVPDVTSDPSNVSVLNTWSYQHSDGNTHFYKLVKADGYVYTSTNNTLDYSTAQSLAGQHLLHGHQGHLLTLTEQGEQNAMLANLPTTGWGNAWMAGTDSANEGIWVWDAGPEAGTQFWDDNSSTGPLDFWSPDFDQPDNYFNEDYTEIYGPGISNSPTPGNAIAELGLINDWKPAGYNLHSVIYAGTDSYIVEFSNEKPVANNNSGTTGYETAVTINILGNDTDADNDALNFVGTSTTSANGGSVILNANGTATYTPPSGYSGTDTYSYTINDTFGSTDSATVTITVQAAPVIIVEPPDCAEYTENASSQAVAPDISFSDLDSPDFQSLELSFQGSGWESTDAITYGPVPSGLTVTPTLSAGVPISLSISGTASDADYTAFAQSINYHSSSENPSEENRTIEWTLVDTEGNDTSATSSVCVDAVADVTVVVPDPDVPDDLNPNTPGFDAGCITDSYTENDGATVMAPSFTLSDLDSPDLTSMTWDLSGAGWESTDTITYGPVPSGLTVNITTAPDGTPTAIIMSGEIAIEDYQTFGQSITYLSTSENPSEGERLVSVTVLDDTADEASANGTEGNPEVGPVSSEIATFNLCVDAVADVTVVVPDPDVPDDLNPNTPGFDAGCITDSYTENDGATVMAPSFTLSDLDSPDLTSMTWDLSGAGWESTDTITYGPVPSGLTVNITTAPDGTPTAIIMSGEIAIEDYQTFGQSITYLSTSENPSEGERLVSVTVLDDTADEASANGTEGNPEVGPVSSEIATFNLCVDAVADVTVVVPDPDVPDDLNPNTPGFDAGCITDSYTENDGATVMAPSFTLSDLDSPDLTSMTWDLSGAGWESTDTITYGPVPSGLTVNITTAPDGTPTAIIMSGEIAIEDYQTFGQSITYLSTSENPSEGERLVSVTVLDDTADEASANGTEGNPEVGPVSSEIATFNLCVDAVADVTVVVPDPDVPDDLNPNTPGFDAGCITDSYTENDGATVMAPSFTLSDLDSPDLTSMTWDLSGAGWESTDTITYGPVPSGLTVNITTAPDGTPTAIIMSGEIAIEDYQTFGQSITYLSTSENPSEGERLVSVTVLDDTADEASANGTEGNPEVGPVSSEIATFNLCVDAVADVTVVVPDPDVPDDLNPNTPGFDAGCITDSYTENDGATVMAPSFTLSDLDSPDLTSMTWDLSGAGWESTDTITYGPVPSGLTVNITTAPDGTPTAIIMSGEIAIEDYQTFGQSITYLSTSENPSEGERLVSVTVLDDTADEASANGTEGNPEVGPVSSEIATFNLCVNEVPDAPVIVTDPNSPSAEGNCVEIAPGQSWTPLLPGITLTDDDSKDFTRLDLHIDIGVGDKIKFDENVFTNENVNVIAVIDSRGDLNIYITGEAPIVEYQDFIDSLDIRNNGQDGSSSHQAPWNLQVWDDTPINPNDPGGDSNGPLVSDPATGKVCVKVPPKPEQPPVIEISTQNVVESRHIATNSIHIEHPADDRELPDYATNQHISLEVRGLDTQLALQSDSTERVISSDSNVINILEHIQSQHEADSNVVDLEQWLSNEGEANALQAVLAATI